jgi:hypothetical protein
MAALERSRLFTDVATDLAIMISYAVVLYPARRPNCWTPCLRVDWRPSLE